VSVILFNKKADIFIGRKSFGVVWEVLLALGLQINLTSSHLEGMWLSVRQLWKITFSQGRVVFSDRCSWEIVEIVDLKPFKTPGLNG